LSTSWNAGLSSGANACPKYIVTETWPLLAFATKSANSAGTRSVTPEIVIEGGPAVAVVVVVGVVVGVIVVAVVVVVVGDVVVAVVTCVVVGEVVVVPLGPGC